MTAPVFIRTPTDVGGVPTISNEADVAAINAPAEALYDATVAGDAADRHDLTH